MANKKVNYGRKVIVTIKKPAPVKRIKVKNVA